MDLDIRVLAGLVLLAAAVAVVGWLWHRARAAARLSPAAQPARAALDTLAAWEPQATRVLTAAECQAFNVLARAYPQHVILAQVPIARFLRVPTRYSYREWLRRVGNQCADLVLCDPRSQVLAVVSVREAGPLSEGSLKRHARMTRVLHAADIPLYTWVEGVLPSPEGARRQIGVDPVVERPPPITPPAMAVVGGEGRRDRPPQRPWGRHADVPQPDEVLEMREPPASSWFDEFDSRRSPLDEATSEDRPRGG